MTEVGTKYANVASLVFGPWLFSSLPALQPNQLPDTERERERERGLCDLGNDIPKNAHLPWLVGLRERRFSTITSFQLFLVFDVFFPEFWEMFKGGLEGLGGLQG